MSPAISRAMSPTPVHGSLRSPGPTKSTTFHTSILASDIIRETKLQVSHIIQAQLTFKSNLNFLPLGSFQINDPYKFQIYIVSYERFFDDMGLSLFISLLEQSTSSVICYYYQSSQQSNQAITNYINELILILVSFLVHYLVVVTIFVESSNRIF